MANQNDEFLTTVSDVVNDILNSMSDKDKLKIKSMPKIQLRNYYHGWGTSIRNKYGLWRGNKALLKDTGCFFPDSASMVIMEAVWSALQETIDEKTALN